MSFGERLDNLMFFLAASIQQYAVVRDKDVRKFLDGIYVSERGLIPEDL